MMNHTPRGDRRAGAAVSSAAAVDAVAAAFDAVVTTAAVDTVVTVVDAVDVDADLTSVPSRQ